MASRPHNQNLVERRPSPKGRISARSRQPFWLPASGFYVLAAAIGITVFFLVWGILLDGEEETPLIPAGILASCVLGGAVILREVVLRQRRNNLLLAQERLDYNLKNAYRRIHSTADENKLTLEKNAAILKEIAQKSEAANVLGKSPEGHWEVFELCNQYLNRSERELETVRVGSPRLATLNRSRETVQNLHRFHLLAWSSAESRSLIQEAQNSVTITKKLEIATRALNILDSAIQFYPNEQSLLDSATAVNEFIATSKISHWVEQAERSAFKGNYKRAINHYRDALFYLARQNIRSSERDLIAEKINLEIGKLKEISIEKPKPKPFHE